MLLKNTFLKIKKHLGRYLSLFIIIVVGVGFYAGVDAMVSSITRVAHGYYDEHRLMHVKIVSTMGLTGEDALALEALPGVAGAIPSYSLDVRSGRTTLRVHALEPLVNTVSLSAGRLPLSPQECLADERFYRVGDTIRLTDDSEGGLLDTTLSVVGVCRSVLYVSKEYGSTTVGNGRLDSFLFVPREAFSLPAFTEIYVLGDTRALTYSEAYARFSADLTEQITAIRGAREEARYQALSSEALAEITDSEDELAREQAAAEAALREARDELAAGEAELERTEAERLAEFAAAEATLSGAWETLNAALSAAALTRAQLPLALQALASQLAALQSQLEALPPDSPEYAACLAAIEGGQAQLEDLQSLQSTVETLTAQEQALADGRAAFERATEAAWQTLADAGTDLTARERELTDRLADATAQIEAARATLAEMPHPVWYVADRSAVVGYHELGSALSVVTAIAAVLPWLFILIALLMTSNSMARMITEERGELGTLASLGYRDGQIIFGYLVYVLTAASLGAVAGYFAGCRLIPPLIYSNFTFLLPPLRITFSLLTLCTLLLVTWLLMSGVTVVACRRALRQKPAALLRPLPPARGKQIFLERVGFLWNRLSFTWKVTLRNLFRYKKRALMTVLGVSGCASLLLVAFGLRDSMNGIAERQYGDMMRYNHLITLQEGAATDPALPELLLREGLQDPLFLHQSLCHLAQGDTPLDCYLVVPQDEGLFAGYYRLTSTLTGERITLGDGGVVVTRRLAKLYDLRQGDTLWVRDRAGARYALTVADVAENYAGHYLYLTGDLYERVFGEDPALNTIVALHRADDEPALAERLMASGLVLNVTFTSDALRAVEESTASLDGVVVLITFVASALAVVVLYNLTSINISERTRELATLKVLGFRDGESNTYIYREAWLLTAASIGVGLVLGFFLHRFIIGEIEAQAISLVRSVKWYSYLGAGLLTLVFSAIMQGVTYASIHKINMIESLKSVE
ncbi:MAG: FtsX-like permease family protein [Eubacteriales bacterium]